MGHDNRSEDRAPVGMVLTYTDAPTDYDGFGTTTVREVGRTTRGATVRLVSTPPEHMQWQRDRYASGLHLYADENRWSEISDALLESAPRYDAEGSRLTDCCGALSTYCDDVLCCKSCWHPVPEGQGDGTESKGGSL